MRAETLTRMAGQIAANCSGLADEQAVSKVADHLHAFWTPEMVRELAAYDRDHPGELDPRVSTALARILA